MTKLRVHELAKELGMENKELMDVLAKKHVEVKSHMSSLSDEVVESCAEHVQGKQEQRQKMLRKRKILCRYPPAEFKKRKPSSIRSASGKWTEWTGCSTFRASGRRKKRTASGIRFQRISSGPPGKRTSGKWRKQKTAGRTSFRQPSVRRRTEKRISSGSSGFQKK